MVISNSCSLRNSGFTLIELMIVVAIIGILSAIAIPNFIRYQLRAKTAEAKTTIGSLRVSQESFKANWDAYIPCSATLALVNATKQAWPTPAPGFDVVGFVPTANTFYGYEIAVAGVTMMANIAGSGLVGQSGGYVITAYGDLDENGVNGEFGYTSNTALINTTGSVAGTVTVNGAVQDLSSGNF